MDLELALPPKGPREVRNLSRLSKFQLVSGYMHLAVLNCPRPLQEMMCNAILYAVVYYLQLINTDASLTATAIRAGHHACRLPENAGPRAAQLWLDGLRSWIAEFFRCEECQRHFLEQLHDPSVKEIKSKREAVLWMWSTHNRVNKRIAGVSHACPAQTVFLSCL